MQSGQNVQSATADTSAQSEHKSFAYYIGKKYDRTKKAQGGDRKSSGKNFHLNPEKTAEAIASEHEHPPPHPPRALPGSPPMSYPEGPSLQPLTRKGGGFLYFVKL
ncbi:MAG TPA: hypothetical protein DDW94_11535 [Deltaproteobacteria bacterium]|nr:MAG: hypothetical protein A3I81_12560 [Deltaproteobacteria bacterium RIFCSPLOWO2_02_FULL_55_12]OIJ72691.1 MAG: hypothetical protein A2V21_312665 [Deltaproteobacteria bacterium GWC2_55_46]HBG47601.1 hypothetical protein [Deltaproteobacteria bacterium]HCY10512.1 hypothetical protein [Deltaproteobacteria bacterium]